MPTVEPAEGQILSLVHDRSAPLAELSKHVIVRKGLADHRLSSTLGEAPILRLFDGIPAFVARF